uniref:Uncharacterized protein n=1 Tax=Rhabditophanes sp. KR3021 TaxID=114890 RepID=A0AC35U4Y9_9BILA
MMGASLECAIYCLLSSAVVFYPKHNTEKCSYCLDVRSIVPECEDNILECQKTNPEGVLYCLTVYEYGDKISSAVRCLSLEDFNLSDLKEVSQNMTDFEVLNSVQHSQCGHKYMKECQCSTCKMEKPMLPPKPFVINDILQRELGNVVTKDLTSPETDQIDLDDGGEYVENNNSGFILYEYGKQIFKKLLFSPNDTSSNNTNIFLLLLSFILIHFLTY